MRFVISAAYAAAWLIVDLPQASAQSRWVPCAEEGEFCNIPYSTVVRFGARGIFAQRRVTGGGVPCINEVFGDPLVGVVKRCAYLAQGEGRNDTDEGEWRRCAVEGGYCAFRGAAIVRYGARGAYTYRRAVNGIECINEVFGDPIVGVPKRCDMRRD